MGVIKTLTNQTLAKNMKQQSKKQQANPLSTRFYIVSF